MKKITFLFLAITLVINVSAQSPTITSVKTKTNPYAKLGKKEQVAGFDKYMDVYKENSPLELFGFVYDPKLGKVTEIKDYIPETVVVNYPQANNETSDSYQYKESTPARWLSVDPVMHAFESPYAAFKENPIIYTDPDGRDWILSTGNKIYWYGGQVGDHKNLLATYKASSGFTGKDGNGNSFDLRNSKFQNIKNGGPTPEGNYHINLAPDPNRQAEAVKTSEGFQLKRSEEGGIEKVGKIYTNEEKTRYVDFTNVWGENRAHLEPEKVTGATSEERDNNSYYIHDSQKNYTSGCTETEGDFFERLTKFRTENKDEKDIKVIVKYPSQDHSTNGGDRKKTK